MVKIAILQSLLGLAHSWSAQVGPALALRAAGLTDALLTAVPIAAAPSEASMGGAWVVFVDGSSGNGRAASGAGAVLYEPSGQLACARARFLGCSDSCTAEYAALELGLRTAAPFAPQRLVVCSDARVVVDCVRAESRATPRRMRAAHARVIEAQAALADADVRYAHVPRARNARADALARCAVRVASSLSSELLRAAALSHDGERAARLLRDARAAGLAVSRPAWLALIASCARSNGAESAMHVARAAAAAAARARDGSGAGNDADALLLASACAEGAWRCEAVDENIARWGELALAQLLARDGVSVTNVSEARGDSCGALAPASAAGALAVGRGGEYAPWALPGAVVAAAAAARAWRSAMAAGPWGAWAPRSESGAPPPP
ncbi:hypothetical protein KFE25_000139 [Diacronema lutheri]|uniref:RNase H type-1 domain-containing protein n=1 Tax=Diacronema lutheri TaxID=2081491 RepID=A0A8J6CAD3_DIALT|nr:hypothetical protein KFE25_000139 [Diacronema lutheri]